YTVNALTKLNLSLPFHYSLNQLNRVNRWRFLLVKVTTIPGYFVLLFKYIFLIDIHLYHLLVRRFKENEETIHACYRYIGELDTLLSVKQWRYHHENCQTPIVKSNLKFKGLTHPLIEQAVPNDFDFTQNVLLTGSNASGKSTFMKAIALNLILAQAVQTVTAQQFHYQPGIVKTTMANADDVLSGDSYFMAEIKSLRRLLNFDASIPHYFFIDEIFKGTNTAERIAASQAVLEYLAQFQGIKVIAATHDIELTRQLHPIYANYHFNETIQQNAIHFDYTIKKGPANTRNALELIRIMDFPLTIYQNAKQHVESFDHKNTDAQY
ncbi:DNA mismatch repair protein MutS, partial [Staphylococcus chromogenes]